MSKHSSTLLPKLGQALSRLQTSTRKMVAVAVARGATRSQPTAVAIGNDEPASQRLWQEPKKTSMAATAVAAAAVVLTSNIEAVVGMAMKVDRNNFPVFLVTIGRVFNFKEAVVGVAMKVDRDNFPVF